MKLNDMSKWEKFWFFGVWSAPIGLFISCLIALLMSHYRSMAVYGLLDSKFIGFNAKEVLVIISGPIVAMILMTISNTIRLINGYTDFRPHLFGKESVTALSRDKQVAMRQAVPVEYRNERPNGETIGKVGHDFVCLPFLKSPEHQLIIGAPGSGKSSMIINSLIWNFNFALPKDRLNAVLAVDCKPELSRKSVYEGRKDIKVINPTVETSYGFDVFYGLSEQSSDDDLMTRCTEISRSLVVNPGGNNSFFYHTAQKVIAGFIAYGFRKHISFSESILMIMGVSAKDLITQILADPEMKQHGKIKSCISAYEDDKSEAFQDVVSTMQEDLGCFAYDTVQHCLDRSNSHIASPLDLQNGISLFLAIPDHLITTYSPVFRMIIQLCMKYLTSIPEWETEDRAPIWFLIDEAGSIGPIPDLVKEGIPRGRSKGLEITLVVQSYSQLIESYGQAGADSILDSCRTTLVLSCNDPRTQRIFSGWTGMYRETKQSHQKNPVVFGRVTGTINESVEYRPVMDVSDIKNLERENKILVFTRRGWFLADKCPYFEIEKYRKKSEEIKEKNKRFYIR